MKTQYEFQNKRFTPCIQHNEIKRKKIYNFLTYKNKIKEKRLNSSNNSKKYDTSGIKISNQRSKRNKIELYYIIIISLIILLHLFANVISSQEMKSYESKIILKIKQSGTSKIYNSNFNYSPDKIMINGESYQVNDNYYFYSAKNTIELIWNKINFESCEKMFFECSNISEIIFGNFFNESTIRDINNMFNGCSLLKSVNLGESNFSQINNMSNMFRNCISLTSLNLSYLSISEKALMDYMFYNCSSLKYINMKRFINDNDNDLSNNNNNYNLTNYYNMFYNIPENIVICISPENKKILNELSKNVKCYTNDCSDSWKINKMNTKDNIKSCINKCFNISENCHNDCAKKYLTNICYKTCSHFYYFDNDNNYICTKNDSCPKDYNTLISNTKECIDNSLDTIIHDINDIQRNLTISLDRTYKIHIYDDYIIANYTKEIIPTTNKDTINYKIINMSSIVSDHCQKKLKLYYNISDNEKLYIFETHRVNKSETLFEIYTKLNETNFQNINLSICEEIKIEPYIPIDMDIIPIKNISNYDNFDEYVSSYYNDICFPVQSSSGADIPLGERQNQFIEMIDRLCDNNCKFVGYEKETRKAKCSCETNGANTNITTINLQEQHQNSNIDKIIDKVFSLIGEQIDKYRKDITETDKFIIIYSIFKCYKNLKKINFKNNIGFYFIGLIIIFNIISCILFFKSSFGKIKHKISDIIFAKKYIHDNDKEYILNKKTKNKPKTRKKLIAYKNENNTNNELNLNNNKANQINLPTNNNNTIKKKIKSKVKKNNKIKIQATNAEVNEKENLNKKVIDIMKLTDDELYDLDYDGAIKKDKRTYCQYSCSLIKQNHPIVSTFFYNNDYNSKLLKINVFVLSFIICYNSCVFFYDQEKLSEIYYSNNAYKYNAVDTIYNSIITAVLSKIFKILAFSNDNILKIKNSKFKKKNFDEKEEKLIKKLKIKFILFFIIGFIYLLFCWYALTSFGILYSNSQKYSLYDTIISFSNRISIPILIFFIPGIFRKLALSNPKKKRVCLYKFSKIFQFILLLFA